MSERGGQSPNRFRAYLADMSIQRRVFLVLLLLSLLLGISIIIPGYLKIRHFEWLEARDHALARSQHLHAEIEERIAILEKAGVAEIESYVLQSKIDLIEEFSTAEADTRVSLHVAEAGGRLLLDGGDGISQAIEQGLLLQMTASEDNYLSHRFQGQNWLTTFVQHEPWGWHLISMISEREVYHESNQYLQYVIVISAVVLLLILILFIALTRDLRNGIGTILSQLESIGKGHYDQRLEVTGPGELGLLQKSINAMVDQIELEIMTRKGVEKDLNTARIQAEETSQVSSGQVIELGKQFKNSMNSVCGFSELLLKTDLDERQRTYIENILKANRQLMLLVNDMLSLSGIDNSHQTASCKFNPDAVANHALLDDIEVLLLEMDPLNQGYVREVLETNRLRVVETEPDARPGMEPGTHRVDLVLLDDHQIGHTTKAQSAFMHAHLAPYLGEVPILIITSENNPRQAERYRNAGATACIAKPFNSTELLNKISELVTAT